MKIGILTFHSQLNYGGVLQCLALQTALEMMGHEVVVIDRWMTPDNWPLERGYDRKRKKWWLHFWFRSLLGLADMRFWLRVHRTKRFIREKLHLTPYHFYDWKDAPRKLGVDMIVVGSDQVWHCGDFGDPRPYLLEGAPNVPAIAYAASFGFPTLPQKLGQSVGTDAEFLAEPIYQSGLSRFQAIGCREAEGVGICRALGFEATHVADPTLLLNSSKWMSIAKYCIATNRITPPRRILCYFLGESVHSMLPILISFAKHHHIQIDVLTKDWEQHNDILPTPRSLLTLRQWGARFVHRMRKIQIRTNAGPIEFIQMHCKADAIVTDSFHSLAFSALFGKNVRFLAPTTDNRRAMFGRIADFAANADGPLVCATLSEALESLVCGIRTEICQEYIEYIRGKSMRFLREVLR